MTSSIGSLGKRKEFDMERPSLKVFVALLGLPLLVAVADWAWTQGPVLKYQSDGVYASYHLYEETAVEWTGDDPVYSYREADVSISEGSESMATGGISGRYFWFNFSVSVGTPSGYGGVGGSGPIPADYVTEKAGKRTLSLTVNTDLLEEPFYKYKWGEIDIQFPEIDLSWTRAGNDWYRWEGHRVADIGNLVEHYQGSGVEYFSIPTGTITLPDIGFIEWVYMDGWLGSRKARTTVIEHRPRH
jgi:hypothetical protein